MNRSIGAIELRCISKGIEIANELVKKATVEIIFLKTICPGKFLVIITGDEGEVAESIAYGMTLNDGSIVDHFIVNAVSEAVIQALKSRYGSKEVRSALGIVETNKVCAGVKMLDKALKVSDIALLKMHVAFGIGGKLVFIITGTLSSIEYGLKEGKAILDKNEHANISIIPSPSEDMTRHLF